MKKVSKYTAKRRAPGARTYNGMAFFNVMQDCRQYTDEPIPGSNLTGTAVAATVALLKITGAFDRLKRGETPKTDFEDFDILAHAIGVALIRAEQIAGIEFEKNPMLERIVKGSLGLSRCKERYKATKKWGFDGPALIDIEQALELYDVIIRASSPKQMNIAAQEREKRIIKSSQKGMAV